MAILFLAVLLATMNQAVVASQACSNWPEWRGDGTGVSECEAPPIEWGDGRGVVWESEIPGKGMSSPIVSNGRLFVTTGVQGRSRVFLRRIHGVALLLIIAIGLAWAIRTRPRTLRIADWRGTLNAALPGMAVVVASVAMVAGDFAINVENNAAYNWIAGSISRRWLVTGLTAGAVIAASCLTHRGARRGRVVLGTVVVAAALFFLFGLPDPRQHVNLVVHGVNGAYLGLGLALGWGWSTGRRKFASWLATVAVGLPFVLALYIHWIGSVRLGYLRFSISAAGLTAVLIAIAIQIGPSRDTCPVAECGPVRRSYSMVAWMFLIAASAQFYANNYLLPEKGIVRATYCLDEGTGAVLWNEGFLAPEDPLVALTSHATPTPGADDDHVFAYFGPTGLVAYSHTGKEEWRTGPLPIESEYSVASSPVVESGSVFLACDQSGPSFLSAYDAMTGAEKWRVDRETDNSFGTPLVATVHEAEQLLVAAGGSVAGYEPSTGRELWSEPSDRTEAIPSPIVVDDLLFVGGDFRGEKLRAYRIPRADEVGTEPIRFETRKPVVGYCSPIAVGRRIYTVTNFGIVHVVDADNGDLIWRERLPGNYFASPVAAGGYVYFLSDDCTTTVIRDAELPEIVASNELSGACLSSPAIAGDRLFIRSLDRIWAVTTNRAEGGLSAKRSPR